MRGPRSSTLAALIAALLPLPALAAGNPPSNAGDDADHGKSPSSASPASPAAAAAPEVKSAPALAPVSVVYKRLDAARNGLSPQTGSSVYHFDAPDIEALPLGESTPLNQVLARAPGVVQDSFGQLHVRGDHANLQYRINGVVIPEAISGFGQVLDTRFANEINLITGALPAQYGYRTAGVVDIQTKSGHVQPFGSIGTIVGTDGHRELNGQAGGTAGRLTYYLTGSVLRSDLGIENPEGTRDPIHDKTRQAKGFGYFSYLLNDDQRVNLMVGSSYGHFQIPNVTGQTPGFMLDGAPALLSQNLDANQAERNNFQVLGLQGRIAGATDYQVSYFHRTSSVQYSPDPIGDLEFNGIAANIFRQNIAQGVQADFSTRLNEQHTLRYGLFYQHEHFDTANASMVFPADDAGNQTSGTPIAIQDNTQITGFEYGVYAQDEWKPTSALTVNYGARFDKVNTVTNEQQFSPRLGLTYDLTPSTRVHAGYARYFTPPPTEIIDTTSVQKFQGTTNALPSDANTAVRSERSNYYDVGIAQQLTPNLTVGLDAYYRQVRHLQDEGQFGNALIFSAFNYAEGKIRGLELSTTYHNHNLQVYGNLALSQALGKGIETGQFNFDDAELAYTQANWVHLDHDQKLTGAVGASYRWMQTDFNADMLFASGLRNGFANTDHLPFNVEVNVGAHRDFVVPGAGRVGVRLSVVNLFDRVYQLRDGTGIGVGASQFGLRRTAYLGLTKYF